MAVHFSERIQAILFVVVLTGAIAGLYAATLLEQPASVHAQVVYGAKLDVVGNGWSIHYAPPATRNNTAFGILLEANATLGFSLTYVPYQIPRGIFVTAINGSVNGDGGYWQYWVNGVYGDVASDHMALHDNDRVLWSYGPSQEGA